jgi:Uma2 family endonuclease
MARMAPSDAGLTLAEHYAAGEDSGMRRELVDGVLIVSPYASRRHAVAAQRLSLILSASCPAELLVCGSPINVDRDPATNLQPDLSVIRVEDLDAPATEGRPLLAVEILSPSTRRFDVTLKRQLYAEMGIASYWVVDIEEPSVTILELDGEVYVDAARLQGATRQHVARPFPVEFAATDLTTLLP